MDAIAELRQAIIAGEMARSTELTKKALEAGNDAGKILGDALISGMDEIGELFKCNEIYVPEVLLAAKSMQQAMQILKPRLVEGGIKARGKVVVGTVRGDPGPLSPSASPPATFHLSRREPIT